jgi:1,4-alpha-glucan branching enzyme
MLSQAHISLSTPCGATVVPGGGVMFRVWAPRSTDVFLNGTFGANTYLNNAANGRLSKDAAGFWAGFESDAKAGDEYTFFVMNASQGHKRDPYARQLKESGFPDSNSIVCDPEAYPWHDGVFQTPDFSNLILYQIHIGTYAISRPGVASNFLDVVGKIPYLQALGINMLQPLPIDEQEANPNMGYGGADLFSPDFPYVCTDHALLPSYLGTINGLLASKGQPPLHLADITPGPNQLKVLVDLCHLHGVAVALDVVYNHAGGFSVNGALDDNCLYYMDRVRNVGNNNDSLYFTDQDRGTGGLAFALWNRPVTQLLLDNARAFLAEYHVDGFRYDEISTLLSCNLGSGWDFCREITDNNRKIAPRVLQNAEFWPGSQSDIPNSQSPIVQAASAGGAGFDVVQADALRNALIDVVSAAANGESANVSMTAIANALYPAGFDHAWRAVTCIENHDLVLAGRKPRIPALADSSDHRSWYARSRTRAAMSILLTAPGIPAALHGTGVPRRQAMGHVTGWPSPALVGRRGEGPRPRHDRPPSLHPGSDPPALDLSRAARRECPSVSGERLRPCAWLPSMARWLEGSGDDVVMVASLAEQTRWGYTVGFPSGGFWREVFNSDVYDHWVNPQVAGNGGGVTANGDGVQGFRASASVVIPANAVVVFARA